MATTRQPKVALRRLGTQQRDRYLAALSPDSAPVEGKSLAQKLEFSYRYAALIKLHDQNNAIFGSWQWMLQNDSSFTLASIASVDLGELPAAASQAMRAFEQARDMSARSEAISRLYLYVNQLAKNLADWVTRISLVADDQLGLQATILEIVRTDVGGWIAPLGACLHGLSGMLSQTPSLLMDHDFFADLYYIQTHLVAVMALPADAGVDLVSFSDLTSYFDFLRDLYKYLYRCNVHVQETLGPMLPLSLEQPNHTPSNVLLLVMQALMEPASNLLNTITRRHLDFYYRQVLQMAPLPPRPDHVRVQFVLKKDVNTALVAAGTALLAGKGAAGEDLIYKTDKELLVNKTKIAAAMTVHNTGVNATPTGLGQLFVSASANAVSPWPPFGGPLANAVVLAPVGIVIGDPVLLMSMGTRQIMLAFACEADSFTAFGANLQAWARQAESTEATFLRLLGDALAVSYTGPKGWVQTPLATKLQMLEDATGTAAQLGLSANTVGCWLSLNLDADAPAVVAYDPALHGPGLGEGLPLLRLQLVSPADALPDEPSPYNLLRGLAFTSIAIQVSVAGKTDLAVQNDLSAVNSQKPFQIFGPAPELGANLYVGSTEAFRKQLTGLQITLDWSKLPVLPKGFADYYAIWNEVLQTPAIHNDSFRVRVSLLQKRAWIPLKPQGDADADDFLLFDWEKGLPPADTDPSKAPFSPSFWLVKNLQPDTPETEAALLGNSVRDGKLKALTLLQNFDWSSFDTSLQPILAGPMPAPFTYTSDQPSGFLRLQLSAPTYGFGAALFSEANYQVNAANIANMTAVAKDTTNKTQLNLIAPPATPFVPMAAGLSIDYVAQSRIEVGKMPANALFWLQPFGVTAVSPNADQAVTLLPDYADEGVLYLGLSDVVAPQTLTILAQVDENSASTSISAKPKITWSYLAAGQWVDFKSTEVLSDGTLNLSQSGIIELVLNVGPSSDGGWFNSRPDNISLLWLRATVPNASPATCQILLLDTQAVTATYEIGPSADAHLAAPLPAGTATKMVAPLGTIDKVLQPYDGYGGKPGESDEQMFTRVHERLRHKNRGISQWEIERILLEAFPEIGVANCFNHSTLDSTAFPGKALVIVFPAGASAGQSNPYRPKFPLSKLNQYQTFLQGLVPSAMAVTVANPPYEQLQVQAIVRFMPGMDPGYYLGRLNADLCAYIAPWATAGVDRNPFDNLLSRALLKGFINGLDYIEGVVGAVNVFQSWEKDGEPYYVTTAGDYDYFQPHQPWYLLTTATQHLLVDADSPASFQSLTLGMVVEPALNPDAPGIGTAGIAQMPMGALEPGLQEYLVVNLKT